MRSRGAVVHLSFFHPLLDTWAAMFRLLHMMLWMWVCTQLSRSLILIPWMHTYTWHGCITWLFGSDFRSRGLCWDCVICRHQCGMPAPFQKVKRCPHLWVSQPACLGRWELLAHCFRPLPAACPAFSWPACWSPSRALRSLRASCTGTRSCPCDSFMSSTPHPILHGILEGLGGVGSVLIPVILGGTGQAD